MGGEEGLMYFAVDIHKRVYYRTLIDNLYKGLNQVSFFLISVLE